MLYFIITEFSAVLVTIKSQSNFVNCLSKLVCVVLINFAVEFFYTDFQDLCITTQYSISFTVSNVTVLFLFHAY